MIVHGRKEAAVREAVEFVEGCRSGEAKVEGIVADISSLQGMNDLCDEVLARTDRLDCLLNNAGEGRRAARDLRVIGEPVGLPACWPAGLPVDRYVSST